MSVFLLHAFLFFGLGQHGWLRSFSGYALGVSEFLNHSLIEK